MRLRFALSATLTLTLTGCGLARDPKELVRDDNATCEGMGLKIGTPEFAQCRLAMLQRRDTADASANAARMQGLQNLGNSIQPGTGLRDYQAATAVSPLGLGGNRIDLYHH